MPSEIESPTKSDIRPRTKDWWIAPFLFLVSASLLAAIYIQYHWPGSWFRSAAPLSWSGASLNLTQGDGNKGDRTLTIEALSDKGVAIAAVVTKVFRARDYLTVSWDVVNNQPDANILFLWRTTENPEHLFSRRIVSTASGLAPLDMTDEENWRGHIVGLALLVKGDIKAPLTLNKVSLKPVSASEALKKIAELWFIENGWAATSINFEDENTSQVEIPFSVAVSAAVLLALCLYLILTKIRILQANIVVVWCVVLVGWFVLDATWQWKLFHRLATTAQQYAGKSWEDKHLASDDGVLFDFMRKVNEKIPKTTRVLYFSDDSYFQRKGAYYLFPNNVLAGQGFSVAGKFRAGDYIVLFAKNGVQYDAAQQTITWNGIPPLNVELLISVAGNFLLKVR